MTLANGDTLAHYRITAAIGAGGMGEMYRASAGRDRGGLQHRPWNQALISLAVALTTH